MNLRPRSFVIRALFAFFQLTILLCCGVASAADHQTIVLSFSEAQLDPFVRRLRAELVSAGYSEVVLEWRTPLGTCASRPTTESGPGQVGVLLRLENEREITSEICAHPQPNQVTVVTGRGRLQEQAHFAIVVTEALHGLLTTPLSTDPKAIGEPNLPPTKEPEPQREEQGTVDSASRPSAWVQPQVVVDAPTGKTWAGVAPGLQVPVTPHVTAAAELLLGLHSIEYTDDEIDLKSRIAWARLMVQSSRIFGPLAVGYTASCGLYVNRVTADAVAPRRGGSDGAFGAILGAGVFGELPARGRLYAKGSLGASTLVPRLRYQMSDEATPALGALLLEAGLGLGLRFGN